MHEVVAELCFMAPCLGNVLTKTSQSPLWRMPRDPSDPDRVLFMPHWWRAGAVYGAAVARVGQSLVRHIDWSPSVQGVIKTFRRRLRDGYALHEAFLPNSILRVSATLPRGLDPAEFRAVLSCFGAHRGISPFVDRDRNFGLFVVKTLGCHGTVTCERGPCPDD